MKPAENLDLNFTLVSPEVAHLLYLQGCGVFRINWVGLTCEAQIDEPPDDQIEW